MITGKTIALTRQTFVDKVMSLLFNMLSRLVITFLPRSKRLLISWLQSPFLVIKEGQKPWSVRVPLFIHLIKGISNDNSKLWKTLKEMGIPDHLTCFLRNLYAGQEATVRTGHGTTDWFQIGKGVRQGCILSPCLYTEYIMRNAGLDEAKAGIKIARRNINNLRYADDSWDPLDCKEIQPVHSKGDQSWVFFGRNNAKAETPVLWPPHAKSWFIEKDSDAARHWGQEEKGTTENEIAGWHDWLDGQ